jgi:hypothetical protein
MCLATLAACDTTNRAPGNDTEADIARAQPAAPRVQASVATSAVGAANIHPESMSPADIASLGGDTARCSFRMTRDDFPSLVYGTASAAMRMNGRIVILPGAGEGRYASAGLRVQVSPVTGDRLQAGSLVVTLEGNPDERGYSGYVQCARGG